MFFLLVSDFDKMIYKQLWMRTGTSKKPKYLPIHTVCERLRETIPELETILSFHAITGCDTVSYFAGYRKKTSWKTFKEHHMSVGKFTCKIYNATDEESCNEARATLFSRCRSPEALPPTNHAA